MSNNSNAHLSERVTVTDLERGQLIVLPTDVEQVVSCKGSLVVYPDFAAGDELLQELAVQMLDKGTVHRDRFELARVLEDCGAQLHLSSDGLRVRFSVKSLRKDVPQILDVLVEMLAEPAFTEEEFAKARAQVAAQLQREMEDTSSVAASALERAIYDEAHPNYSPEHLELLKQLQQVDLKAVRNFHSDHFGPNKLTIAAVGDVDADEIRDQVMSTVGTWTGESPTPTHSSAATAPEAGTTDIPMPDKSNLDVYMGHGLSLRRFDDDYIPLYVGNYVLGGNFSARLMAEVRDEAGLTYGIGSNLSGITSEYDGHWATNVTLSQQHVDQGIEMTRAVIEEFVEHGITEDELADKKTTITGSFIVGLTSTTRLANTLRANAEREFPVSYLDEFPGRVNELSTEQVNDVIKRHIMPHKMHIARAGELEAAAVE